MDEYFFKTWKYKEFTEAEKLESYLQEIRPMFLGKPLTKVMMMGINFNDDYREATEEEIKLYNLQDEDEKFISYDNQTDGSKTENAELWVDEPLVFFIGENRLEIDQADEGSHIYIGINQLTFTENSYQNTDCLDYKAPPHIWKDISVAYSKNCINQIVEDIYINKTNHIRTFGDSNCSGDNGDDMFYEFCIKFENSSEIVFSTILNYTLVTERKHYAKRELIERENNEGYDDWDNMFEKGVDKKNFFAIVNGSNPKNVKQFKTDFYAEYNWLMFNFILTTDIGESYLYIPGYTGEMNKLLYLLERMVLHKFSQHYRYFDEEGFRSFLCIRPIDRNDNLISVFQLSDNLYYHTYNEKTKKYTNTKVYKQTVDDIYEEPVVLRNAIIVDRKQFIKEIYNAYKKMVNVDRNIVCSQWLDDFDNIIKSSDIIENYLNQ